MMRSLGRLGVDCVIVAAVAVLAVALAAGLGVIVAFLVLVHWPPVMIDAARVRLKGRIGAVDWW